LTALETGLGLLRAAMSATRFIPQDPTRSAYTARVKDWEDHETFIRQLHEEGYTRKAILETLKREGSFSPS